VRRIEAVLTSTLVIAPVFALILSGFLVGRLGLLGPEAASELNKFVIFLALPALLFQVMAETDWKASWQSGFVIAFIVGMFVIFALVLIARVISGQSLTDASIEALNAGYANTGYVGFPICEAVFGRGSFSLVTIAAVLTVSALFGAAIVGIEIGRQTEPRAHRIALKVAGSLSKNPLIVAPLLGGLWAATQVPLPGIATTYLHLLGSSASPCALVSLGLFISHTRGRPSTALRLVSLLSALKLLGQPAVTALIAGPVLHLSRQTASIAVLLAALPTGTGPFMLAEYYRREALITSETILWTTVLSIVTLTLLISAIQ
jgi:malonate transporter and related proteins